MANEKEVFSIHTSIHPEYASLYMDWEKFRFVWEGGVDFRENYLESYSAREDTDDFEVRTFGSLDETQHRSRQTDVQPRHDDALSSGFDH